MIKTPNPSRFTTAFAFRHLEAGKCSLHASGSLSESEGYLKDTIIHQGEKPENYLLMVSYTETKGDQAARPRAPCPELLLDMARQSHAGAERLQN